MQTFLPVPDFLLSAQLLDNKRLGKQRVEAMQIHLAISDPGYGWQHHPAVNMWRGYAEALAEYGMAMCVEWRWRGFNDNLLSVFMKRVGTATAPKPYWFGKAEFHLSHQANLVRKAPEFYLPLVGKEFAPMEELLGHWSYYWPVVS